MLQEFARVAPVPRRIISLDAELVKIVKVKDSGRYVYGAVLYLDNGRLYWYEIHYIHIYF